MCLTPMLSRALTKTSATVCDISASHVNPPRSASKKNGISTYLKLQLLRIAAPTQRSVPTRAHYCSVFGGGKTHEMRGDAKPAAVAPLVNVRVTAIRCFASEPYIFVTGMDNGDVAQNPHHHIHRLSMRARIGIGDTLEKRFAIQQDAIWGGNVEVFRKILSVPPYIRLECGSYVVSVQFQQHFKITGICFFERGLLHCYARICRGVASGRICRSVGDTSTFGHDHCA